MLGLLHLAKTMFVPFEAQFSEFTTKLQGCYQDVKEEIRLASDQAAHNERQLQLVERNKAEKEREFGKLLRRNISKFSNEDRAWKMKMQAKDTRREKQRLLEKLSTHDYLTPFKRERKKRFGSPRYLLTCLLAYSFPIWIILFALSCLSSNLLSYLQQRMLRNRLTDSSCYRLWVEETIEFQSWLGNSGSSTFWLSGILGSGKSVMTATVIDRLLINAAANNMLMFFFCQHDNESSLKADTLFRSIVRQGLAIDSLSDSLKESLSQLLDGRTMEEDELKQLVLETIKSNTKKNIIVIDGFDEMISEERSATLSILQCLLSAEIGLKLLLSSRSDVETDIRRHFSPSLYKIDMQRHEVGQDIAMYIQADLEERRNRPPGTQGRLIVSNPSLIEDIANALIKGAQGM